MKRLADQFRVAPIHTVVIIVHDAFELLLCTHMTSPLAVRNNARNILGDKFYRTELMRSRLAKSSNVIALCESCARRNRRIILIYSTTVSHLEQYQGLSCGSIIAMTTEIAPSNFKLGFRVGCKAGAAQRICRRNFQPCMSANRSSVAKTTGF